jgi:polyphosphate kinase 2 (PPK2 family)
MFHHTAQSLYKRYRSTLVPQHGIRLVVNTMTRQLLKNKLCCMIADKSQSLLIILQGIDTSGKDGTIRHVMGALNPQSYRVESFKAPTTEELLHDYLWRIHRLIPSKGDVSIFNRSHYGDVIEVRVHNLVTKSEWSKRYRQINEFERYLSENHIKIIKFFLHISKEEQKRDFRRD